MTIELAETMAAVFEDMVGTPPPEEKGDAAVVWYLKARQRLNKRRQDIEETYKAMQTECAAWALAQTESLDRSQAWIDDAYEATAKTITSAKIAHSGKKSFDFCYGVCSFKKQQDKYEWPADEAELLAWCGNNYVQVNTKTTINKQAIKDHYNATGEEPPGVTVTPGVEKFYVKPAPLALPREQLKLLGKEPKEM